MKIAKMFECGAGQAVRLPRGFHFEGDEVLIQRIGDAVVSLPKGRSWKALTGSLAKFPDDFMSDRSQPQEVESRERR
jgi:antitoxin VapB